MWVYTYVSVCTCRCSVYLYLYVCVRLCVTAFRTRSCDPNSVTGDSDLCPLWTRYHGDSKTGPWDDPLISTGSCNEDQMTIRFQNRIISYEYLFLYHFSYLPLSIYICVLLWSFHVTVWCILPVWLLVSLHETSKNAHFIYVIDMSIYWCHFMC